MPQTSSLDSGKYETALRVCWQATRLPYNIQQRERRRKRGKCGALGDRALPIGVGLYIRYCTVTSVPTGISEKNLRAVSSGNRMQPCDAG